MTTTRRAAVLIAVTTLAVLGAAPGASAQQVVTVEEYIARLQAAADRASEATSTPSPEAMDQVRATVGLPLSVSSGSGTIAIREDGYLEGLEGDDAQDFLNAEEHLDAVRIAAEETVGLSDLPSDVDGTIAGQAGAPTKSDEPSLLERLLRWLDRSLQGAGPTLGVILRILLAVIVLLIIGLMVWLIWRFRPSLVVRRGDGESDDGGDGGGGRTATDWRRTMRGAVSRGDFAAAVRAAYHLLVRTLVRRGFAPRLPGLTAGECRSAVARTKPALGETVGTATRVFEGIAYGDQPAGPADLDVLISAEREAAHA